MSYIISKEFTVDSCHYLRNYKGKCANLHGHTYKIVVEIEGDTLDELGMLYDFGNIKSLISNIFDHQCINDIKPFDAAINPTAENMTKFIFDLVDSVLEQTSNKPRCRSVIVWETPTSWAKYGE
jgi:6-pyruvoyltetrahydropterin/6-carboxytetrahydropterin synthase